MTSITQICMLAGDEPHYVHSVVQELANTGLKIELLGSRIYEPYPYPPEVQFTNVRQSLGSNRSIISKIRSMLGFYLRSSYLIYQSKCKILHIQRFRFNFFEGLILVFLYRLMGKTVVYTAHNVQPKGKLTGYKQFIFWFIYRNVNNTICHTHEMKRTLVARYGIRPEKVSVIHHGINMSVSISDISREAARQKLDLPLHAKVLLVFGRIKPHKGVELAIESLKHLRASSEPVILIVAGNRHNNRGYLSKIQEHVEREGATSQVQFHIYPFPDDDIELFFKSADVLLLPYTEGDFQSGVLFLALRFGLPVIASNLGSFPECVEDGVNGFLFNSGDPRDLAAKVEQFYKELYSQPDLRENVRQQALQTYNWGRISQMTREVYQRLVGAET